MLRMLEGHTSPVSSLAFSLDGKRVLAGFENDGTVGLWETTSGKLLRMLTGHTSDVSSIVFSPDGYLAITVEALGRMFFWRMIGVIDV